MKLSKRLLSMMLVLVFCLTSFAVAPVSAASAAFTDLTEEHYAYDAVNVLSKLGVINGYEENGSFNFKPDNNVTRAEFAAMLLRTRGMGSVGSMSLENPPFPDVTTPDVSWAIGNIRTARELGIINGYDDGTFKPNNNVSYEEAVTMIVRALGYGEMGSEGAFWYSKYIMTATSLGFMEGAGGAIATPATRATIASMLYNCLEVNLAEDNKITDKTILENDLKLTKMVGYISSNPTISLSKPDANLRDDEVEITVNGVASTYKVDDASKYNDMLGAQIEFYFKTDFDSGFKTLLLATVKNSTTIKIDASIIQNASASGISYFKNEDAERETKVGIASNSVVVYNGKIYGEDAENSTFSIYYGEKGIPKVGNFELIDRNGDDVFDVVFINDYEPYFVSSVTPSDYKITDDALRKGLDAAYRQVKLDHKSHDINFFNVDGSATSFSAIKKGSVIFVARHNHSVNDAKVIVCNDTVSGKVTATSSSKGYTINGKNYKVSRLAPWKTVIKVKDETGTEIEASPELIDEPEMGDTAKFYLDMEGNIIWYDKTQAVTNHQYGYIIDANVVEKDFEKTAGVVISTSSRAEGSSYTITTKTKLDGETFEDLYDFVAALDSSNDDDENDDFKQLVKFSISKGTEIDEIITATVVDEGKDIKNNKLYDYSLVEDTDWLTYKKTGNKLDSIYIGSAAFILNVSDGKYKTMKVSDFMNNTEYRVKIYDVTTTDSAKAIIVFEGNTNIGKLTGTSPVVLVNEIEHGEKYVIRDVNGNEYVLDDDDDTNDVAAMVKQGDVVRLGGSEGKYTLGEDGSDKGCVVFRLSDDPTDNGLFDIKYNENDNVNYRAIWGSVYQQDADRIIVSQTVLDSADESPETYEILKSYFKGAKIYRINEDNNELITDITGDGYAAVLESMVHYNDAGDAASKPSEIFIHMSNNTTVKMMIVIER